MLAFLRTLLAVVVGIFLSFFLLFFFILVIASASRVEVGVKNNTVLKLDLDHRIPERPVDNPLGKLSLFKKNFRQPLSLFEIVRDIKQAKYDSRIKGIYIEPGIVETDYATLEEIRKALTDFRKSGKFVYSYGEYYVQKGYYVASAADSIFLNPTGIFSFAGFHSEQLFLRGLFDKLEIEPKLIRAGKYKSAGEMFINSSLSDPNREQLTAYINSAYDVFLDKIDSARHIPGDDLRNIANKLLVKFPEDALKYRLIDKIAYKDEVIASIKARLKLGKSESVNKLDMEDYNEAEGRPQPDKKIAFTGDRIALIYAVGDISGGQGNEEEIGSEKLSETIRNARNDETIKAIVLRINSPGGGALASDVIWREVKLASAAKPVIASFGSLAASGGYYIAAPASYIFTEPNTITGSIGVFGIIPILDKFWKDKLGITWDRVKTGPYADLGNPNRPMTQEEENIIQAWIDTTYEQFKRRVAEGRHLSMPFVDSIAQGRIYSGIQGKKIGLVDQIGYLDDAIAFAAQKAHLEHYRISVLPEYETSLRKLLRGVSGSEDMLKESLGEDYSLFQKVRKYKEMKGVMMRLPWEISE